MSGEQLDLLISRSLDGDLSPEEHHDLETVLANDAAARRRHEELAGLVAEARALPSPAPPFALSTRVNANVSEKAARGGSILNRFGFYPPPGLAIGAMVVLAVAAVAITLVNPSPTRVASTIAERTDGPVDVFFQEGARAKDAAKDVAKKAAPLSGESVGAKIAAKEKTREERGAIPSAPAGILESKEVGSIASVVASNEPALDEKVNDKQNEKLNEKQGKLAKSEADADVDSTRTRQASVESPAPSAPAPAVRAMKSVETRTWSVAIRGEGAKRWMLRRAPEGRPSSSAQLSSFRVTLDAAGRVTAARALDARAVPPAVLEFVRGLVFAPVAGGTANAVGAVSDGFSRDREQKAKDERTDALLEKKADKNAESPAEIEVEISAH